MVCGCPERKQVLTPPAERSRRALGRLRDIVSTRPEGRWFSATVCCLRRRTWVVRWASDGGRGQELAPGTVRRAGPWAVGNIDGRYLPWAPLSALGADPPGSIDADGCLICPWHAPPTTSSPAACAAVRGVFARIPGLGAAYRALTVVLPLPRAKVTVRDGSVVVSS